MDSLNEMEARLWEYIDGLGNDAQKTAVKKLIDENSEWRAKYGELLELHQLVLATELEQPSLRFTKNVMEEIARYHIAPATRSYINKKVIWGIGLFFLTVIVGFLVYGFGQIDWSAASDNKTSLGVDFSKVDYSRVFSNNFVNIFIMLNIVLGLMLLDRYLSNRNKLIRQGE
ncbi:MAG: hypothetical protein ACJ75B_13970 [Flavisolibacter sp.]|jgi:hypothetical protein